MGNNPFLERLLFKETPVGVVERDGHKYRKYKKVARFPHGKKVVRFISAVCAILLLLAFAAWFNSIITMSKKRMP